MSEHKKLRSCPKCGNQPYYKRVGDYNQYVVVECQACHYCAAKYGEARLTKWGARILWNKKVKEQERG